MIVYLIPIDTTMFRPESFVKVEIFQCDHIPAITSSHFKIIVILF